MQKNKDYLAMVINQMHQYLRPCQAVSFAKIAPPVCHGELSRDATLALTGFHTKNPNFSAKLYLLYYPEFPHPLRVIAHGFHRI